MWELISDKDTAWGYFEAGCLWYGDPKSIDAMYKYPRNGWTAEEWQSGFADQLYRNYIRVEV